MADKPPMLWRAKDLAPARPSRADTNPEFLAVALTIHCPVCPASPGQPCRTRRPRGYHIARADRGLRRSVKLRARNG